MPFRDLITAAYDPNDVIEIRYLRPVTKDGGSRYVPLSSWYSWTMVSELDFEQAIEFARQKRVDAFWGPGTRNEVGGGKLENVRRCPLLYADFDNTDLDNVEEILAASDIPPPNAVVTSGGGVHCYWRLAEPLVDLSEFRGRQKALAAALGSDGAVIDASRMMRIPASYSFKRDSQTRLVRLDVHSAYDVDDFPDAALDRSPANGTANGHNGTATEVNLSKKTLKFLAMGAPNHARNSQLSAAVRDMKGNQISFEEASERLWHGAQQCDPPMEREEFDYCVRKNFAGDRYPSVPREPKTTARPVVIPWSEHKREAIRFLWQPYLPFGKIVMIASLPGLGKTFFTAYVAARASRGGEFFCADSGHEPLNVLIMNGEDGLGDTMRERLEMAGADLDRVFSLNDIEIAPSEGEPSLISVNFMAHLELIEQAIVETQARVLVVDTVNNFVGDLKTESDVEARGRFFNPLSRLAAEHGVCVILVSHLNKVTGAAALHRVMGGGAFVGFPRAVYLIGADEDDRACRHLIPAKYSLGPEPPGLRFRIIDGAIAFDAERSLMTADDITAPRKKTGPAPAKRQAAEQFLRTQLAVGQREASVIRRAAEEAGIKLRTLDGARHHLGVESVKRDGAIFYRMPYDPDLDG